MGKGKIVLRTIWNVVFLAFLLFMFAAWLEMFYAPDAALFQTFLLPSTALMLIYHVYTSVMYYIYCFKHRNDEIHFKNKDKSKVKTIISTILLIGTVTCFMLYTISAPMMIMYDGTLEKEFDFVVNDECLSEYLFVDDADVVTERELTESSQYSFLSMYAAKGEIKTKNTATDEWVSTIRFEYAENLPWYVDMTIKKDMLDNVSTKISMNIDGKDYDSVHLEKEVDGLEITYSYLVCEKSNFIDVCIIDGDRLFLVSEIWESCVEMDIETRLDEWIEIYKNI